MDNFTPQQIEEFLQEFFDTVGARQYVGARYVPIFGRAGEDTVEWDDGAPYEPLTVVMHLGVSYVSRRYVPAGIQITDTAYWVETYRFNAQVEQYRQEVLSFQGQIDQIREDMGSDYVPFPDPDFYPKYGTSGQVLTTLANGDTKWEDPVTVTADVAEPLIEAWLDDHPEATTTVQDGAVTTAKLHDGAVTKPKMAQNGVPNEAYALMGLFKALQCNVTGDNYTLTFMQGGFYQTLVWASAQNQVTTLPIFLPKGAIIDVVSATCPDGASLYVAPYTESGFMSGTYSRGTQRSISTGSNYTAQQDMIVTIGCFLAAGVTPSDVSVTITIDVSNDVMRQLVNTLNNSTYKSKLITTSTDVNDFTNIGTYWVNADFDNTPENMETNGVLQCFNWSNTRKLQVISTGAPTGKTEGQMFFRTWRNDADNGYWTKWMQIYPALKDTVRLYYVSENLWKLDFGNVTINLRHVISQPDDADLWNLYQVYRSDSNVQLDTGDIIGPVRITGAPDYTFGYHGSATTTKIVVFADSAVVTLDENTDITCEQLRIAMHDEGRHPTTLEHIMDRDVVIDATRNKMHCWNTFKNVSGSQLSIQNACNGGLLACFDNLVNAYVSNETVSDSAYTEDLPQSRNLVMASFVLNGFTMTAKNIIGHELSTYRGQARYYPGTSSRDKVYFFTMLNETLDDGDSVVGEFEYTFE